MMKSLLYRLFQAALVVLVVGVLTFFLVQSLPGDMAWRIAAGRYGYDLVDAAAAAKVQQELSASLSGGSALLAWFGDLLRFDFGRSLVSGEAVNQEIAWQLGHTLALAVCALLLTIAIGIPAGIYAALRPGSRFDRLLMWLSTALRSLPHFAIGLLLVALLASGLDLLPAAGAESPAHIVLPALTLALSLSAVAARVARDAMRHVADSASYRWGRQKGLGEGRLFWRHGLRNVSVPVVAWLSVQFMYLIEGMVVVETLFAWPGIAHALVHAIFHRDVPVIQGTAMVLGLMFVILNMLVDILCRWLDPRSAARG